MEPIDDDVGDGRAWALSSGLAFQPVVTITVSLGFCRNSWPMKSATLGYDHYLVVRSVRSEGGSGATVDISYLILAPPLYAYALEYS